MISEVIYALETFDPLIIRCGIAHYLLCEHISKTSDVKVLLSGEGADELFGSYAYIQREFFINFCVFRILKMINNPFIELSFFIKSNSF